MRTAENHVFKSSTGFLVVLFLVSLLNGSSCSDDSNVLPAPTQEGLNTFGCLVNGEVWRPEGKPRDNKLDLSYDPGFMGGVLTINANRLRSNEDKEFMFLFSRNTNQGGQYLLNDINKAAATYASNECSYDRDSSVYRQGILMITRLDLEARIISGTFEFVLARPDCDTVRVTDGRFDMKI